MATAPPSELPIRCSGPVLAERVQGGRTRRRRATARVTGPGSRSDNPKPGMSTLITRSRRQPVVLRRPVLQAAADAVQQQRPAGAPVAGRRCDADPGAAARVAPCLDHRAVTVRPGVAAPRRRGRR